MNIDALKAETDTDPLARGYAGMTEAAVADSLNAINRSRNRTSVSPGEMQRAVDGAEFVALSDVKQRAWLAILSDSVDPNNANTIAQVTAIWTSGTTLTNLAALQTEAVSRAVEIGLGFVKQGHVQEARRL